jgi:hypothetical protein
LFFIVALSEIDGPPKKLDTDQLAGFSFAACRVPSVARNASENSNLGSPAR